MSGPCVRPPPPGATTDKCSFKFHSFDQLKDVLCLSARRSQLSPVRVAVVRHSGAVSCVSVIHSAPSTTPAVMTTSSNAVRFSYKNTSTHSAAL